MAETFADVSNSIVKHVDMFDEFEKDAGTALTGVIATSDAALESVKGEKAQAAKDGVESFVASAASCLSDALIRLVLLPLFLELAQTTEVNKPAANGEIAFEEVFNYCRTTPRHVKASGDTYDTSATAGASNVSTGNLYRLTVDRSGFPLAGLDPDTYTVRCVSYARETRRAHDERFEIKGTAGRDDNLDYTGTDLGDFFFAGATGAGSALVNASFDQAQFSGSTISSMQGWRTATDGASAVPNSNVEIEETNTFRTTPGSTNSRAITFTGNETLYQDLVANNQRILANTPYLIGVRVRRDASATGTVELRMSGTLGSGGVSNTLDVSTLSADTYGNLIIPIGANCYPENWNENDLKFQIKVTSLSGEITVDDCVLHPMQRFGSSLAGRPGFGGLGQYVVFWGGQTPCVEGDTWTFTDTESTRSVVNYWLRKGEIGYLPEIADATQVTAAGGRTLTFADADPDTITASSGDFTSDGFSAGMKLTVAGTSNNNGTFVIASVTATVITLESGEELTAEGPLSSTATLDATAYFENP